MSVPLIVAILNTDVPTKRFLAMMEMMPLLITVMAILVAYMWNKKLDTN
jgi:ABC-type Fe3+ transport system permease subunit